MSKNTPAPIGRLEDVGGHRLHYLAIGEGSPTVIFEAGGAGWSMDWHLVQTEVAKFTSAVSYDRAGFGWSDPGPKPRTSGQIVKELHTLLSKASFKKPFVFVGASFGGHTVRLYTSSYPNEVAGMVLLDARHESVNAKMPPAWKNLEAAGKGMYQVMLLASRLNALKLLAKLGGEKAMPAIVKKLPLEIQSTYLEAGFHPNYFQANLDELAASAESDRQLSASGSLRDIPLIVIRHGNPQMFAQMPAPQAAQAERVWQELQAGLAQLSSKGQLLVAENSGHGIQIEQPALVVETIRQMAQKIRGV